MPVFPSPFIGTDRFRPLEFVGSGSMGAVYRVYDEELGSEVALKTLLRFDPEQIYRLKGEFRALAGVVHPNLVQLHDLIVSDDACFFTMEFVDGVDFVAYVQGAKSDSHEDRLRRFLFAAPQLVRGLSAVHAASRLHRDVKPSNIQVARDGRVVLLDFDLTVPVVGGEALTSFASAVAGSWAYMAPEQARGAGVGPGADMYAVGVVFFEALTGRLPCDGSLQEIFLFKDSVKPPRVGQFVATVPESVDALVADLMARTATQRPDAAQTLARLNAPYARAVVASAAERTDFVGRERDLAQLLTIMARSDRATVVRVDGPSGIGKSELVRRLLSVCETRESIVLLRGRCHPQESVPYKALDPIVDALSRFLANLPVAETEALLPHYASELAKLFPVLERVPELSATRARREDADSVEVRRRGFAAFRDLLGRIDQSRPVVIWIDDLQWGDTDSATLIGELLRPPDVPPIRLILSYRSEDRSSIPLLPILEDLRGQVGGPLVHDLSLGPLDTEATQRLAMELCPAELRSAEHVSLLAQQSGGSPFLLGALAWHLGDRTARAGRPESKQIALGDMVRDRLDALTKEGRQIIKLVAVAGGPVDRTTLLRAAQHGEAGRPLIARLEGELLLRATTVADRPGVEAYHDRFREAVVAQLGTEERTGCHRDLALALESSGRAEAEVLAQQFHGAGLSSKAADYAVAAADKAAEAMAFVRAAELYRQARAWDPRDATWARVLLTREGDSLSNAARFADGAQALLTAAEGAPRQEALELRRRATENLLAGGEMDDGVRTLSALLGDLGLSFPRTQAAATRRAAWRIGDLLLRGIDRGTARAVDAEDLLRIDTCFSASKGFVDTDPVRGVYFALEALARAMRVREPIRLGCTLCVVGGSLRVVGGQLLARAGERMMQRAEAIAAETGSPRLLGTIAVGTGQVHMLHGRWRAALEQCDAGAQLLAERCRGEAHSSNIGRGMALRAVEELGDMLDLEERARELLKASAVARDRFAEVMASQHMSTVRLARDDPAGARTFALRGWELSHSTFQLQHLYSLRQQAYCDLYEGRPEDSYARLCKLWRDARRAGVLRVSLARIDALSIRGRLALAIASRKHTAGDALLRDCAWAARMLERERRPDATVHALLLRAGLASVRGDLGLAVARFEQAERSACDGGMALHAAVASYRIGELLGAATGSTLTTEASTVLTRNGIQLPKAWSAVYAPGCWIST